MNHLLKFFGIQKKRKKKLGQRAGKAQKKLLRKAAKARRKRGGRA